MSFGVSSISSLKLVSKTVAKIDKLGIRTANKGNQDVDSVSLELPQYFFKRCQGNEINHSIKYGLTNKIRDGDA